jgi:hypothetical protein
MKINSQLKAKVLLQNRISSGSALTVAKINATFGVKAKGLLLGVFLRMLLPIGLTKTVARAKTILIFLTFCKTLFRAQGMKGLVNYLKACQVLLQQSLGGFRLHDASELKCRPSRNGMGLPRLISAQDRALIRAGNWRVMKFYMTLFALFRVLEFPCKLKLDTITDGFSGDMSQGSLYWRLVAYAPAFAKMLKRHAKVHSVQPLETRGVEPRPIVKSAPGVVLGLISTSPWVLVSQAFNLRRLGLGDCIEYFLKYFQKGTKVPYPGLLSIWQGASHIPMGLIPSLSHSIGKLGFKEEAAGKVRVFAMADAWTQWVLEPFHSYLFDILRDIDMDGTFDQLKPVRAKAATCQAAYSLDLTAATDRLPIALQAVLFSHLISGEFAVQWMRLLVGREYSAFSTKYSVSKELRYAVGQPMGALSSWASLAITHHFLVQCAAWEAGVTPAGTWFQDYAVLGDDLVIFNQKVKVSYLKIVNAIGVQCGIAKSLLSPKGIAIEFAKRTFWKGIDISPIPLLEFVAANLTLSDAIQFARKYNLTFPKLLRSLGYGYRVVGSVNKHVGQLNSRVRALLFSFYLPETEEDVSRLLTQGNPLLSKTNLDLVLKEFKAYLSENYLKTIKSRLGSLQDPATLIREEGEKALGVLTRRMYVVGFLQTWLDKVLPGADVSSVPQTEVLDDIYQPLSGWRRPGFEIFEDSKQSVINVPPATYNRFEGVIRNWRLAFERVVKLVVATPMATFRNDALKLINYEIHAIRYGRTMQTSYLQLLKVVRLLSAAGTGAVPLARVDEKLQWRSDPVQMRFWIDFTKCILRVLKRTQGKDSPQKR